MLMLYIHIIALYLCERGLRYLEIICNRVLLGSVYDLVFPLQNLQQELQKNPDSLPFDEVCILDPINYISALTAFDDQLELITSIYFNGRYFTAILEILNPLANSQLHISEK